MSIRPATVWVLSCDAPRCIRLAVPATLRTAQREKDRRALHLSHTVDAFTTAETEGWVREIRGYTDWAYYCPDHTNVPARPQPIRARAGSDQPRTIEKKESTVDRAREETTRTTESEEIAQQALDLQRPSFPDRDSYCRPPKNETEDR